MTFIIQTFVAMNFHPKKKGQHNNNANGQTVHYILLTGFDDSSLLSELKVFECLRSTAHPISTENINHILHEIHLMEFTWTKSSQNTKNST